MMEELELPRSGNTSETLKSLGKKGGKIVAGALVASLAASSAAGYVPEKKSGQQIRIPPTTPTSGEFILPPQPGYTKHTYYAKNPEGTVYGPKGILCPDDCDTKGEWVPVPQESGWVWIIGPADPEYGK